MSHSPWRLVAASVALLAMLTACTSVPQSGATDEVPTTSVGDDGSALAGVPDEARTAAGEGEPRSAGYWVIWSSCGENNRADTAAANGGREAGWILMDDLLAFPGVTLGDRPVGTCEEGVTVLATEGDPDPLERLARQLLTAELNLNSGSETCPAAEETVTVAHALLSSLGDAGPGRATPTIDDEASDSLGRVADLLAAYNSGELCR